MIRLDSSTANFEQSLAVIVSAGTRSTDSVREAVAAILADVRTRGDDAVCAYTSRFDRVAATAATLRVDEATIGTAVAEVPKALRAALDLAATRIERFHRAQLPADLELDDPAGLSLGMRWTALDAVGLYVPGGKASYPSSVLMNAIPARVAGVKRIAMCVPSPDGVLNPLVLAAAQCAGVSEIYRVGGAQAIGALAFGTATIAAVDRIVGPGNAWVAEAKRQVFGHVGIDSVAGPSEVVVVADAGCNPREVAIDLLAQAEHDEMSRAILITESVTLADAVEASVADELSRLPRAAIAAASWRDHGAIILVPTLADAACLCDRLAPEHLQIMTADPRAFFGRVRHAGAAFLGRYCPEALGDYIAGPNHVLPTGGTARFASGLSVFDFLKRTTWIESSEAGLAAIGPQAVALARAEGLDAHAESIARRLQSNAALA